MKKLVLNFPNQLKEALIIGQNYQFTSTQSDFKNIVVTGLGGSGIGASIVQNFVFDKLKIPFIVNKDYFMPSFINNQSLVIVCSYSGNTEETLEALNEAIKSGATICCITSGGKVAEIAKEKGYNCIIVPPGMPPRSCLGYSLVQILFVLYHFGLINNTFETEINAAIALLNANEEDIQNKAHKVAKKLKGKIPVVYSSSTHEGVAIRFRQQLNENSKVLAWHGAIPEMNHNELVGWRDEAKEIAVMILRNVDDYSRVQTRMEINKKIIKKCKSDIIEIYSEGASYWEKVFYLIHLTDWISVFLADLRKVDATEVNVIDFLKGSLAKEGTEKTKK